MHTRNTPIIDQVTIVLGSVQAGLGVLTGASVLTDLHPAIPTILAVCTILVGALQASLRHAAQAATVPAEDVVEVAVGSEVYAGDGHDTLSAGDQVRQLEPVLPIRRRDRRTHDHP